MKVVQCWDDGVTADIPLITILKKYEAKASFNLNMDVHKKVQGEGRPYQDTTVHAVLLGDLREVYEGFTIANHSLTHPHMEELPADKVRFEASENRKKLQDLFGQPIDGFVYPYGTYNQLTIDVLSEEGYRYARTTKNAEPCFPPLEPMAFHPSAHFLDTDFWDKYEAAKQSGVFYFWGHSYENISETMWDNFDRLIQKITEDPEAEWEDLPNLFR